MNIRAGRGLNATQASAAHATIELWDDVIAADIVQAANPNTADIRFSNSSTGVSYAHAYYPGVTGADTYSYQAAQGSIWFNQAYGSLTDPHAGEYGWMAFAHEIGHTLGLSHPGNYNGGSPTYATHALYEQDTHQYTLMSYFAANNTGADWWANGGRWQWAQTPMLHDIMVAQSMYGADMTTRAGDTVYGFNATAGNSLYDFSVNLNPVLAIWDGGGEDTLDLSGWGTGSTISLVEGTFSHGNWMTHNLAIAHGAVIENAIGGAGNDLITGNAADNTLDGGAGADQMAGGAGDDLFLVDNAGDTVSENAGEGTDTVHASVSFALGANVENLLLVGSGNLNGTGNAFANTITGNAGNNTLDGGGGADLLAGGLGNDIYVVDNAGDVVNEGAGAGTDAVHASIGYALGANLENLTLLGSGHIAGTGNVLANIVTGNAGDNVLDGGAGYDVLLGGAGNDRLIYDASDNLAAYDGGTGSDTLVINGGNLPVLSLAAIDVEWAEHVLADTGANAWLTMTDLYDQNWQQVSQAGTNDDGSSWNTQWDLAGTQYWNQRTQNFDSSNRLHDESGVYDDGRSWQKIWDVDDVAGWSLMTSLTDHANAMNWFNFTRTYDDASRLYEEAGTFDDGRTWLSRWDVYNVEVWSFQKTLNDVADALLWDEITYRTDDEGRLYEEIGTYDDGRSWQKVWDVDDVAAWNWREISQDISDDFVWSSTTSLYDELDRRYEQTGILDNGKTWQSLWDVDNNYIWDHQLTYYDTSERFSWSQVQYRYKRLESALRTNRHI